MKYEFDASKLKVGDKVWYRNHGINREGAVIEIKKHNLVDDRTNFEKKYRHIILDDNDGERYEGHLQVLINAANGIKTEAEHEKKVMNSQQRAGVEKRKRLTLKRINMWEDRKKLYQSKLDLCPPAREEEYKARLNECFTALEELNRKLKIYMRDDELK